MIRELHKEWPRAVLVWWIACLFGSGCASIEGSYTCEAYDAAGGSILIRVDAIEDSDSSKRIFYTVDELTEEGDWRTVGFSWLMREEPAHPVIELFDPSFAVPPYIYQLIPHAGYLELLEADITQGAESFRLRRRRGGRCLWKRKERRSGIPKAPMETGKE